MSTVDVAKFISSIGFDSLSDRVVQQCKIAIKDQLGVMIASVDDRAVKAATDTVASLAGLEQATILGYHKKTSHMLAAMVNATAAATLDMDDGAYKSVGHLVHAGCVVVPTALALTESCGGTGKKLIELSVIGYEVTLRAGWLIRLLGIAAPSGMAGTYGAAAMASKAFSLNLGQTVNALGIADAHCMHPSFAKSSLGKMSMAKEGAGWGAMTGIVAALLAQTGFMGPRTIFDLTEYSKEPLASIGREWEILNLYFKPYSSCRYTHAPIDGVLELMKKHDIKASDISAIILGIATQAAVEMANPRPNNTWEAQFSIPFTVGAAAAYGEVGPMQIDDDHLGDKKILDLADKVTMMGDREVDALRPGMVPAKTRIETVDGRFYETYVPFPWGSPEKIMSKDELDRKFIKITSNMLGEKAKECCHRIDFLEDMNDMAELTEMMK